MLATSPFPPLSTVPSLLLKTIQVLEETQFYLIIIIFMKLLIVLAQRMHSDKSHMAMFSKRQFHFLRLTYMAYITLSHLNIGIRMGNTTSSSQRAANDFSYVGG